MPTKTKLKKGFAALSVARRREIASLGGKAAHEKGTAHTWTQEEARQAGKKGGKAKHKESPEPSGV